MVSLTALVVVIFPNDNAFAGGGGYANCNAVNFGPHCFATYNNHHLRVWDPDGSRPSLTSRQQSDLWQSLLRNHLVDSKNTSYQTLSYKLDRNDVFYDLESIVEDNPFLSDLLQKWKPVESNFCLKKYSAALDYIRALVAEEGVTENVKRLSGARFLLSEPSGNCLNNRNSEDKLDRISKQEIGRQIADLLGPDPSEYSNSFAELKGWLTYLLAAANYHQRSYFLNPKEVGNLISAFEKIALANRRSWVGEGALFTSLQLRFEMIQGGLNKSSFYDLPLWRRNFEDFLSMYPASKYKFTLLEYASGLDFYDGKRKKHFRHVVNLVNIGIPKLERKETLSRFEVEALLSFPRFLDEQTSSEIKVTDHPLIWDFLILTTGSSIKVLVDLCNEVIAAGPVGNEVCNQIRTGEALKSPLIDFPLQPKIARIQYLATSQKYSKALAFTRGLEKENEPALILALGHLFSSANLSDDLEDYMSGLVKFAAEQPENRLLQLLVNYQLMNYSQFLMSVDGMHRLLALPLSQRIRFSVLAPHIEQAILYGEYEDALKLYSAVDVSDDKIVGNKLFDAITSRHKSLIYAIHSLRQDGPNRDYAVGSHIYLYGLIPSCLARAPIPLKTRKNVFCGYLTVDGSGVKFVRKERSNLGQIPLTLFASAQEKLSVSELPGDLEIKILNRLIYCFKGSRRRFSCTRKILAQKTEVRRWFARLNKGEKRQKHWYFDKIYFEPEAWPNYYGKLAGTPVSLGFGPAEHYYFFQRPNR